MHEDFEKYRPKADADVQQLNVRISPDLIDKLRTFAGIEGDSMSALATEGIARVIEDRTNHPNPQMQAKLAERREALLQELQTIDALIPGMPKD